METILRDRRLLGFVLVGTIVLQIGGAAYCWQAGERRHWAHANTLKQMRNVYEALVRHGFEHDDQCPQSMRVLVEHGYILAPAKDAWGTTIAFTCTSPWSPDRALIVSAGPDRTFGTRDDIRSDRD